MTTEEVKDASGRTLTVMNYRGYRFPTAPLSTLQALDTLTFRDDDLLICTYPKSGTHWVFEIARMLLHGRTDLPVVEKDDYMIELGLRDISTVASPRILSTHVLYRQLPTLHAARTKIIYVTRNPRDVAVSFYNHHVKLKDYYHYDGCWDDYFHLFVDGQLDFGSWFDYTRDWEQVISSSSDRILSLSYEDMKENIEAEVSRISQFLGKNYDSGFLREVCDNSDFDKMRARKGHFDLSSDGQPIMYRKGQVGDWQNWFKPEQVARMEEVYQSKMAGSSHVCRYTLPAASGASESVDSNMNTQTN